MERINQLFSELQDYKELKNKRQHKLKEIKKKNDELCELINIRESYSNKEMNLPKLQEKLQEVENEIEKLQIKEKKILNYKDILVIKDDELQKIKSFEFINDIVYDWNENDEQTIVLNKNTIIFFKSMKPKLYYKELKHKYYERLLNYFKGIIYSDLAIEETESEFYFNVRKNLTENHTIIEFYESNKELCNFIFTILSENVDIKTCEQIKNKNNYFKNVWKHNNRILKMTKYYINNIESHIERLILQTIDEICVSYRSNIIIDLDRRGYSFSEEFGLLLFCFENLSDKDRIYSLKSLISEFFSLEKIEKDIFNYVCVFSEIDFMIKNYNFDNLNTQKEILFCHIIEISGVDAINLRNEIDIIKSDIYQNQYAFKEILDQFLNEKLKLAFIITYFDALYDTIVKYILSRQSVSINESECFSEIITFVTELCDLERMLNNSCRLKCVEVVLRSSLREIEELFDNGKICLDSDELSQMICALFTDTHRRSDLLYKIKGK